MGLLNATIMDGATLTCTGGTSKTLAPDSIPVQNGVHLSDFSVTDFRIRPSCTVRNVRQPVYNKTTNKWKKGRRELAFCHPFLLADGSIEYPVFRLEVEDHPEMTDAQYVKLMTWMGQVFSDADFADFVKRGSMA